MTTFTKEQLREMVHDCVTDDPEYPGETIVMDTLGVKLAAFALALMERAENAEAEREAKWRKGQKEGRW